MSTGSERKIPFYLDGDELGLVSLRSQLPTSWFSFKYERPHHSLVFSFHVALDLPAFLSEKTISASASFKVLRFKGHFTLESQGLGSRIQLLSIE